MFCMTTSHGDEVCAVEIRKGVWEAALPEGGVVEFHGDINDAVEGVKGLACMNGGYEWEEEDATEEQAADDAWAEVVRCTNVLDEALRDVKNATNEAEHFDAIERQRKAGAALLAADAEFERIVNGG